MRPDLRPLGSPLASSASSAVASVLGAAQVGPSSTADEPAQRKPQEQRGAEGRKNAGWPGARRRERALWRGDESGRLWRIGVAETFSLGRA